MTSETVYRDAKPGDVPLREDHGMADTRIQIVRGAPHDIPVVKSLLREIETETQSDGLCAQRLAEAGLDHSLASFDSLTSDSFWLLLALVADTPVGYATLVRMPKADVRVAVLYLDEIHVLKQHRRCGVASALIHEAEAITREIGAWRMRLLVDPGNDAARRLYASLGFDESELILCQRSVAT